MIDILISLCLVFALFSGLVSGVSELLAQIVKMRGKVLYEGVAVILGELSNNSYTKTGKFLRIFGLTEKAISKPSGLTAQLFAHPLIDTLSQPGSKASYIESSNFSTALVQVLSGDGTWASLRQSLDDRSKPLGQLFGPMLDEANGDIDKFKSSVESHFNSVMDRVSGWYKRRTQGMMFFIALALAVGLNINTIHITNHLKNNPEQVAKLVNLAKEQTTEIEAAASNDSKLHVPLPNQTASGIEPQPKLEDQQKSLDSLNQQISTLKKDIDDLNKMNLPIFWGKETTEEFEFCKLFSLRFWGWLFTALAATLGAPFWFGVISKLFAIRGTGKKPEEPVVDATSAPQIQVNMPSTSPTAQVENAPVNIYEMNSMNGEDIEALQKALGLPNEKITGQFNSELRAALRQWQIAAGRIANGQFDEASVLAILYPEA